MTSFWPAPAKLNLFLYITGRRETGYHDLQTLFQFLDFGDELAFKVTNDGELRLVTDCEAINHSANLILQAAKCLRDNASTVEKSNAKLGATITLIKRIPMGGGLGGGSSNAATTLVALNQLWQLHFSLEQLLQFGVQLGADVPVFINGATAFAEGIGDKLINTHVPENYYLVAHPGIEISTPLVFNDTELTRDTPIRSLSELLTIPWKNDCEVVVRKRFPEVDELLKWLLQYAPARLTGTGACVFAEFATESAATRILSELPAHFSGFVAKGLNRSPLLQYLKNNRRPTPAA